MSKKLIVAVASIFLGLTGAVHSQVDTSSYPRPSPGGSVLDNAQKWQSLELQHQQIEMQRLQLRQQRMRMQQLEQVQMERQLEFERQQAEQFRKRHPR